MVKVKWNNIFTLQFPLDKENSEKLAIQTCHIPCHITVPLYIIEITIPGVHELAHLDVTMY